MLTALFFFITKLSHATHARNALISRPRGFGVSLIRHSRAQRMSAWLKFLSVKKPPNFDAVHFAATVIFMATQAVVPQLG